MILHDFNLEHYDEIINNYLFIDEVQLGDQFEKAINSIHTKEIFKYAYASGCLSQCSGC